MPSLLPECEHPPPPAKRSVNGLRHVNGLVFHHPSCDLLCRGSCVLLSLAEANGSLRSRIRTSASMSVDPIIRSAPVGLHHTREQKPVLVRLPRAPRVQEQVQDHRIAQSSAGPQSCHLGLREQECSISHACACSLSLPFLPRVPPFKLWVSVSGHARVPCAFEQRK